MSRLLYELTESFRIAWAQICANKMRSALTALGVVIGIVAVTLMGTAIRGINVGFNRSLAMLGDDVLYLDNWPWHNVNDWWNYINRPRIKPEYAAQLNRIIAATPNSELAVAVPAPHLMLSVRKGDLQVDNVYTVGTDGDFAQLIHTDFTAGRFFTGIEANNGRLVCVIGSDVAGALFPGRSAVGQTVKIKGYPFEVIGVLAHQGSFLGLFSFDSTAVVPLGAFEHYLKQNPWAEIRVKVKDKTRMAQATDELEGDMRRVRALAPGAPDDFSINGSEAFKQQLDPIRNGIALAGLFITGLALFVGAIGIMNITFVSVKERTREIGTRKALGARRRTILLQFLIEAVAICLAGGAVGLGLAYGLCALIQVTLPAVPVQFSLGLVVIGGVVSVFTGVVSGFAPALGASRLDPVVALRYE